MADTEAHAYVGRQAIFSSDLRVVAYELLYRDSFENRARFDDVDKASATAMLNAFVEIGLEALVGDLPVYVNLPASFLLGRYPMPIPPERAVLEVLEDVPVTDELVEALRGFKARGYKIALDDFVLDERTQRLVPYADVIKLDVLGAAPERIAADVAALRPSEAQLLAEKVSTHEELEFLRTLELDLYQGFFLQMPIVARARRLPQHRAALVQLLSKLYDPMTDLRGLEPLLAGNVGIAVRVLRLASSAAMSRGTPVASIGDAVRRLGIQQLAALVVVAMVAGFDDKPPELLAQALVRARTCELVARRTGAGSPDELFTAGLLSLLDAMLDQPIAELLARVPVTPAIAGALTGVAGPATRVLDAARAQEHCDFAALAATGVAPDVVGGAWREALGWARALLAVL